MIRVHKSAEVPASLQIANCSSYNGQDIQEALVNDHYEKCYLCEQKTYNLFEIDHFKGQAIHEHLRYEWTNLLLSCRHCNIRKTNDLELLDPVTDNVEDILTQRINLSTRKAEIIALRVGVHENSTVSLLDRIFNGRNQELREIKCELLYKKAEADINLFLGFLVDYKINRNQENKQKVLDSLLITKEFLAFKYWIIKDHEDLFDEFKDCMVWNKLA